VFAGSNWNSIHLASTIDKTAVRLRLPPGTYVVNAKVSVHNLDSDPQPAVCKLIAQPIFPGPPGTTFVFDRTEVRMDHRDGGGRQSVALQGVVTFPLSSFAPSTGRVDLVCDSPNADDSDWVITAIQTTGTFNTPPCPPSSLFCNTYTMPPP
jgi:hypothetical protein